MEFWEKKSSVIRQRRDESVARVLKDDGQIAVPEQITVTTNNVLSEPGKYLTTDAIAITESSIPKLLESLATGDLTALTVVNAFLRRAAIAQRLVNCIHELLPERAITRAKELDEILARTGKPIGPLHGLPISVKAHVGIEGCDLSSGSVAWADTKSPMDAIILQILLGAGAILYARTTEPQGLMIMETRSNLTGVTTNPHNVSLSAGGSSGGEGALIGLRGSLLGIGSDIGGSIRSPSAAAGIYGLRPTASRLPAIGINAYNIGLETIPGTLGPMSTDLEGLSLFMKTILDTEPWNSDLSLHQIPWRESPQFSARKDLVVGILWDDGYVKPSPPVTRALREVVDRLRTTKGFQVIEWKPYKQREAVQLMAKLYSPDGGEKLDSILALSGEPADPLITWTMKEQDGSTVARKQSDVWGWTKEREIYRWSFLQEWNKIASAVDVILCPVTPHPASKHGTSKYWGYTSLWNMLDYPAVVFPVTKVRSTDIWTVSQTPYNELDRWYHENYSVEEQMGLPVNLQLVAKKLQDEKLLQALKVIMDGINLPFADALSGAARLSEGV